jgi:hypothetical protein
MFKKLKREVFLGNRKGEVSVLIISLKIQLKYFPINQGGKPQLVKIGFYT